MSKAYEKIKHKLQSPLDCSGVIDLRGGYFHNRVITNFESVDFHGCVLFHCYPSGFENALEIDPAHSESDVTLRGTSLKEANLSGADLRGAYLQDTDLREAFLQDANLERANLKRADLEYACLENANLQNANLENANLQHADLEGADFTGANLKDATCDVAITDAVVTQEQLATLHILHEYDFYYGRIEEDGDTYDDADDEDDNLFRR